jgi:hypothetical protein
MSARLILSTAYRQGLDDLIKSDLYAPEVAMMLLAIDEDVVTERLKRIEVCLMFSGILIPARMSVLR